MHSITLQWKQFCTASIKPVYSINRRRRLCAGTMDVHWVCLLHFINYFTFHFISVLYLFPPSPPPPPFKPSHPTSLPRTAFSVMGGHLYEHHRKVSKCELLPLLQKCPLKTRLSVNVASSIGKCLFKWSKLQLLGIVLSLLFTGSVWIVNDPVEFGRSHFPIYGSSSSSSSSRLCPSTAGCCPPSMSHHWWGFGLPSTRWPGVLLTGFSFEVLPVVFWLTGLTHKDSGGWGYKGASYPHDSSFFGFLWYFIEVAAPPACSTSPSAAVASWSATTYLPKPYS